MVGKDYFGTVITPFRLNEDAMTLISLLDTKFNREMEERATILLNASELHPGMSTYQLSLTHRAFGDVYYKNSYFGAALEHYKRGLEFNPSLSVKRKIKELEGMPGDEMRFSSSPDLISDVLSFPKYKELIDQYEAKLRTSLSSSAPVDSEIREMSERVQKEIKQENTLSNSIYDPEFEDAVDSVLTVLGEPLKRAFYRNRHITQETEEVSSLSFRQMDILELRAMIKSSVYHGEISQDSAKNLFAILDHLAL